ncbi:MAG TPA: hypothetical protein VGE29_05830 [Prosthecobacter sp.]
MTAAQQDEQRTRERLKNVLDTEDGRFLVDHLQRVFGDSPTKQAPISGDQMRGRFEVIQYLIKNGQLIADRPE